MNILINYFEDRSYPQRTTIADHLYSFQRYSPHHCFYLNWGVRRLPAYLSSVDFDLVIFHTIFLAQRWNRDFFRALMQKAAPLKRLPGVRVAIPQDEFINTDLLCDFINEFGVTHVFSAAAASEWSKIYAGVDFDKVSFSTVLTGYLDDATLSRIDRLAASAPPRSIDIGYRAWRAQPWLGRHGFLKTQIADLFQREASASGLKADISTDSSATLLGDQWYEFLLNCKYTIGVEGGAGILDRDGSLRERTDAYVAAHPQAPFDEVEAACFPGQDGLLKLWAISPRHLEACATRTCQVLVEGAYNGILQPGRHYIELKRDFSNTHEVIRRLKEDRLREPITQQAYADIVQSGKYTYRSFVQSVLAHALPGWPAQADRPALGARLVGAIARFADRLSWAAVAANRWVVLPLKASLRLSLVRLFSEEKVRFAVGRLRGSVRN